MMCAKALVPLLYSYMLLKKQMCKFGFLEVTEIKLEKTEILILCALRFAIITSLLLVNKVTSQCFKCCKACGLIFHTSLKKKIINYYRLLLKSLVG